MTLNCGQGASVKVNRAFHGRHITNDTACEILEDDCTKDHTVTLYNWQVCPQSITHQFVGYFIILR